MTVIADLPVAGRVYAEGWQTWSRPRLLRAGETSPPAPDGRAQLVEWRPGKPVPAGVIQAEGVLGFAPPEGAARAWFSPDPAREVATLRLTRRRDRLEVSADGPVEEVEAPDLERALEAVGDRLRVEHVRDVPAGWCSWSYYFKHVTEDDVVENAQTAGRLELPVEIVQVDDGYETVIGDWLAVRPEFGSLERMAARIRDLGMQPGVWIAPFMVDPRSRVATEHPDWLVRDATAGLHWGEEMRILDVERPAAADYVSRVFGAFADWGFTYIKLDFLYAAAIPGLNAYRRGLRLIRDAVGPEAIVMTGGAPLLPTIGLCDVMRIGPDILPEVPDPQLDLETVVRVTQLRRWMHGRLWVNDPDHLVARPEIADREAWAAYVEGYGGQRFSGDRLAALDARGVELTRRFLAGGAGDEAHR